MDSEKCINWFKMKKIAYLIIENSFFTNFNNFSAPLLCKINVLKISNKVNFIFKFLYVAKYWNFDQMKFLTESVYLQS